MAKRANFFSHDMNARHDPKITAMRGAYKAEGYGWFWMLIEMMSESDGYKLDMQSKYALNAYAMQLQCERNAIASFIEDCIHEFELFATDGTYFWSESLLKRMKFRDEKSEKAAESARKRWNNANALNNDANALQTQSERNANLTKSDAINKTKQNKTKVNETNSSSGVYQTFESEGFGTLSGTIADMIDDSVSTYSEQWVIEAMKEAVRQGKRKMSYVDGILKRWKADGKEEPWKNVIQVSTWNKKDERLSIIEKWGNS